MAKEITSRSEDYSQWYNDLALKGELADHSPVRGCMIIRPYGFAIWEMMKQILDKKLKDTGHQNASFPLFIPKSFFSKEAEHVEGFAKECAVVTHYRLKNNDDNTELIVDPEAKLEEELIVRPTSETIIWNSYKDWIQSYRDLPVLINQWANVVRWEMRTRLFLRTTEFFWQEGHTAHATQAEAEEEARLIAGVYEDLMENYLCIPVASGKKTDSEKFAGAVDTYSMEGLMQDGKALQMGTSHFLGQNFAKAFDVQYLDKEGKLKYVWATSWGVSTRLMGALIMAHGDDDGLIIPPKLAPIQVVIVPIYKNEEDLAAINEKVVLLTNDLQEKGIRVKYDADDNKKPGWKFAEYELKGVPVRIAIGPKDLENNTVEVARRDIKEKSVLEIDNVSEKISKLLDEIQSNIYSKALKFRESHTYSVDNMEEFQKILDSGGGFIHAWWDGTADTEKKIKDLTKATIRYIPQEEQNEEGKCILTGTPTNKRVVFARAY